MPYLTIIRGGQPLQDYLLTEILTTIGSSPESTLCLPDKNIASLHAQIIQREGRFLLINLDVKRRTLVNGKRIEEVALKEGDIVKLGQIELKFSSQPLAAPSFLQKLEAVKTKISPEDYSFLKKEWLLKEQKEKILHTLYKIGPKLNLFKQPQELLRTILDVSLEVLKCEKGYILLKKHTEFIPVAGNLDKVDISYSAIAKVATSKKPLLVPNVLEDVNFKNKKSILLHRIKSILCIPLKNRADEVISILYLSSSTPRVFDEAGLFLIEGLANYAAVALENALLFQKERESIQKEFNQKLEEFKFEDIVFSCEAMQSLQEKIVKIAKTDLSVLITGETGTGKELVARAIHKNSHRSEQPFIVINCGAIPENLLETELFGHTRGAFTGAVSAKQGKFELANKGTILLDEIGEMPLALQVKLLRVLEEKKIEPIGGLKKIPVDVRILAATNKNIPQEIEKGNFRRDLYYRLNEVEFALPPLREREGDILVLANYFLSKFNSEYQKSIKGFTLSARSALLNHPWPGNIRELENRIKRAVVIASGPLITPADLELEEKATLPFKEQHQKIAKRLEREAIKEALKETQGNLSKAASLIGINRKTLRRKIKEYGL
jgi:transcriptional regulator with GAF, ATPase, and Fis domain